MKKRLLSILLTLCMIFTMIPAMSITASAAPATAVYVGGQDVVDGPNITYWLSDGAGSIMGGGDGSNYNVKYDPNGVTPTLTLNNVDITEAYLDSYSPSLNGIYANGDLTIGLAAGTTNTITGADYPGNSSCGIYVDGAIIFQGSGTLSTAGGSASFSYGIFAFTTISILDCTVTAKGTSSNIGRAMDRTPIFEADSYAVTASMNSDGSFPQAYDPLNLFSYKYMHFAPLSQEATPAATFTATGPDNGTLSNVTATMQYSVDNGGTWTAITGTTMDITGVTAANGVKVYQPGNNITTSDSDVQIIAITKAATPSAGKTDCTTLSNNDGKLTGVTAAMEYKLSTAPGWTGSTGSDITGLVNGTYQVRVKAAGTALASDDQTLMIAEFTLPQEATPAATFTATGPDNGTLSNVTAAMKYSVDNGGAWTAITGTTMDITGVTASNGIKVYQPGNNTTTSDSDVQIIVITKAATPSAGKTDCTTLSNNDGKLTGVTAEMEYKLSTAPGWTGGTGSDITGLANGTYQVRVKATGTTLASNDQSITLTAFTGTQEATPAAIFTATGPAGGTLGNVTTAMQYSVDDGDSWAAITGTTMNITGVTEANGVQVYQPGNGTTTSDSDVQIIAITKAATPSLSATQPSAIGGNGSIPMITVHEYSSDGGSTWTQAAGTTSLAADDYLVRVKAAGTALASDDQSITLTAFTGTQEATPAASFAATGPNSGTLGNVTAAMQYSLDDGDTWTAITGTTMDITGVTAANGVKVYQPGNSTTTLDSDIQTIGITKAATPSLSATQPSAIGGKGSIPMTTAHEYISDGGSTWIQAAGTTSLAAGTYLVRVKAAGTALASDDQSITLTAFTGTQEATPAATFTAAGPDNGTLGNVTAAMQYRLDDGNTWTAITGTTMDITGVTTVNGIQVYKPGNSSSTLDSAIQTISITKAAAPSLSATQPSAIGGNGSIPMTTTHEYSSDGGNTWTQAAGTTSLAAGTYQVRVKAAGMALASDNQSITLTAFTGTQEIQPSATADYAAEKLTGLAGSAAYAVNSADIAADGDGKIAIPNAWFGTTISLVKKGDGITTNDSIAQSISLAARPAAPACTATQPSASSSTGIVSGITGTMQYSTDGGISWADGAGGDVSGFAPGTVLFRIKATGSAPASLNQTITITAYSAPPSGGGGGSNTAPLVTKIESGESVANTNMASLVKEGKNLTVEGKAGEMLIFNTEALKIIDSQIKENVKVEIKDVSEAHQDQQPGRIVFSLTITSGSKNVTNFGTGTATVSLPYELKSGEKSENVTVWYLSSDGSMSEIPCTYNPATKLATFKVNHFSLYVVGTANTSSWANPFSDVKESSWFYDAVRYVSANGLMQGMEDTAFNPYAKTTRGMIVTILWRLENEPKAAKALEFTDVKKGRYYYDAVAWASENGIAGGYSAERFGPEDKITREQMAVILYHYAALKGYQTDASADLSTFSDFESVHQWSKDAMSWANATGLINGVSSDRLDSLGNAERCQVAATLQRFMENIAK